MQHNIKPFKIRTAIFFGYNGRPFHGLQKVQGVSTVEEYLEKALFDAKFISSNNFGDLKKIGWNRGSRTDKGVHASLNTIKCNMEISMDYLKDVPEEKMKKNGSVNKTTFKQYLDFDRIKKEINGVLRDDIRVFALRLVTKNFVCKNSATSRKYEYFMPLKILKTEKYKDDTNQDFLKKVNKMLQVYLGTKNYHNFTKKGNFNDKSSLRYIMDIEVKLYKEETEKPFIQIFIHGQSFMYNQIRKMIGAIIQVFQNDFDEQFILNCFGVNVVDTWLAPAEGLLLDRIQFKGYNGKEDIPQKLYITEEEEKEIQKFQQEQIYDKIIQECVEKDIFEQWLEEKKYYQQFIYYNDSKYDIITFIFGISNGFFIENQNGKSSFYLRKSLKQCYGPYIMNFFFQYLSFSKHFLNVQYNSSLYFLQQIMNFLNNLKTLLFLRSIPLSIILNLLINIFLIEELIKNFFTHNKACYYY